MAANDPHDPHATGYPTPPDSGATRYGAQPPDPNANGPQAAPEGADPYATRYGAVPPPDPLATNYPPTPTAPPRQRTRRVLPCRFGDYELLEEIARGGMGVVYRVRQQVGERERLVALKLIRSGRLASGGAVERFLREAHAAAALDHPGIVPIYDIGEVDGDYYFTMQLMPGGSLADLVRERPLPPPVAAQLVRQVAEAVQHAHDKGIIHRDLKPANILLQGIATDEHRSTQMKAEEGIDPSSARVHLCSSAANSSPKITDFGLARTQESGLSLTGEVMGTPGYMPPEQARGEVRTMGPAVDVYGLGAVLYCLLTGRPPFQAADVPETLRQVCEAEPVAPRQLNPGVPRDLETVCLKCLVKEPGKRYESATALAEDLQRWQIGEPTKARPPSALGRAIRWLRINAVAATVIGTVGLTWGCSVGMTTVAAALEAHQLQFWPTYPCHPMAWLRFTKQNPWAQAGLAAVAAVLTLVVGWLMTRVARPKTAGSGFGFSVTTGLIAGVVAFLFIAPFSASGQLLRLRQLDDWRWTRDLRDLQAVASDPAHPARAQLDYLRKWLPREKRTLSYSGWEGDIKTLVLWAEHANFLESSYTDVWFLAVVTMWFFLATSIASNWAIGLVEQRSGWWGWNLLGYAEIYVPAVIAVVSLLIFFTQLVRQILESHPSNDRVFIMRDLPNTAIAACLAAGLVTLSYCGVVRQWRLSHRLVGYFVWLVLVGLFLLECVTA